jgi:hypothetical protein
MSGLLSRRGGIQLVSETYVTLLSLPVLPLYVDLSCILDMLESLSDDMIIREDSDRACIADINPLLEGRNVTVTDTMHRIENLRNGEMQILPRAAPLLRSHRNYTWSLKPVLTASRASSDYHLCMRTVRYS